MLNKFSLSTVLAVATLSMGAMAQSAQAATFNFSFSNEDGSVPGTVEGTIELPDGDGTFAASSIFVNSAPAALGYTLPFDI
ncbi:MAG: PEP-CTERM sorting domain-containing protein, partial [Microcystaceae cyanobacterium]